MSITDELRQYAYGYETMVNHRLLGIADRIDLAHERAIADAELCAAPTEAQLVELGYIALPKDSEGEYIHIGDVMEGVNKYDSLKEVTGEVITIHFDAIGESKFEATVGLRVWAKDGKSYHTSYIDPYASTYRHHHSPTVEDMLYEMYDRLDDPSGDDLSKTLEEIVTEYAAKLQLREDA